MGFWSMIYDTVRLSIILCSDPFKRISRACFSKRKKNIEDEIVLVTGAGQGLGKELALLLAELDPVLVLWDINEERNSAVANKIRLLGHRVHAFKVDISNLQEVVEAGRRVREEIGDVSIVVNNAGVFSGYPLTTIPEHLVRLCFDVNVMGHFWVIQQFLPRMIELNKGHIVAVASFAGHVGVINMTDYCASKYAVVGLMNALYLELRTAHKCIKLTTINPVIISNGFVCNPATRFPSLLPLLDLEKTAKDILDGILLEADEIFIPKRVYWLLNFTKLFSRRAKFEILAYMKYGFDSQKHVQTNGCKNQIVKEV